MKVLSPSQIDRQLKVLSEWRLRRSLLTRTFTFKDFPAAIRFVSKVAKLAEAAWHHPDIDIRWNRVTLSLTTHDAGGLTRKDFSLAGQFDQILSK